MTVSPGAFRNIDNRQVLDIDGRQGIDGITGLGSDTEIVCGRLLEQLLRDEPFLSATSLNDYIGLTYRLRDERAAGRMDFSPPTIYLATVEPKLAEALGALYRCAPVLAVFQLDDILTWAFQLRDGVAPPTIRYALDERW